MVPDRARRQFDAVADDVILPREDIERVLALQRLQLALNVRDLEAAIDFYGKMFGARPNKRKPGYANFAIEDPPLKLVLFELPDAPERLNHLGVETVVSYPGCCGMPFLEQAELARVADNAAKVSKELVKLIDSGHDIVALTASCGLMLKFEWALICPDNPDVKKVAEHTWDIDEYVVDVMKKDGVPGAMQPLPEGVTAKTDKNMLILSGIDKQALGGAAAKIRSFRPPEPYKGKGIKYKEETIVRKAGKTAGK